MNKYFKDYTIIDAYKSVIRAFEMLRKPGIVFTEEQKKKIMELGDNRYKQQEIILKLLEEKEENNESV